MYNTVSNLEIDLLTIYPTDYSIANLHTFIQIFLIFCIKKTSRLLLFVGAAHTQPLE